MDERPLGMAVLVPGVRTVEIAMTEESGPDFASMELGSFLEALSAKSPMPGGGASACVAGAIALAQAQMVLAYTLGKARFASHEGANRLAHTSLGNARTLMLRLAREDAQAYAMLNELQRLDADDPRRRRELPASAALCVAIPMNALAVCADAARILADLPARTNEHLLSDLAIAAALLDASARCCVMNVRVNLPLLPEGDRGEPLERSRAMAAQTRGLLAPIISSMLAD